MLTKGSRDFEPGNAYLLTSLLASACPIEGIGSFRSETH